MVFQQFINPNISFKNASKIKLYLITKYFKVKKSNRNIKKLLKSLLKTKHNVPKVKPKPVKNKLKKPSNHYTIKNIFKIKTVNITHSKMKLLIMKLIAGNQSLRKHTNKLQKTINGNGDRGLKVLT